MSRHNAAYLASGVVMLAALMSGLALVVVYGFEPPGWLLRAEMAALMAAALVCGFARRLPALTPWLRMRPVRGAALVVLGVAAVYLPPPLVVSAVLIASGVRMVWAEACELADAEKVPVPTGKAVVRAAAPHSSPDVSALPADATPVAELVMAPPAGARGVPARRNRQDGPPAIARIDGILIRLD
jgi:hypothetical protein